MSKAEEIALSKYPVLKTELGDINYLPRISFIEGYRQAEIDLTDISWIKEVSGVKELSRAKEEALKAYPPRSIAANYGTIDRRDAFEYGYLKAQKDNELTWEDLAIIKQLSDDFVKHNQTPMSDEEFYKEIVKRFKERKEK